MAKINGGIIGPNNPTGPFSAGGVWRLEDAFNAQKAGEWPLVLGYQIPNSVRFNSGSSDSLTRTPATTGTSRRIMTFSFWTKRSGFETTNAYRLFSTFYGGGASQFWIRFADSSEGIDKISIASYDSGFSLNLITTQVFRDPLAWYHFVISFDTTQGTSSNRVKMYVNGEQVTSFSTATYPSQNYDLQWNVTEANQIGGNAVSANEFYNGYFSEIYFIDGQQLTPSSFGQTDATTGIWQPIAYTGSFGTNGFYLKFQDSSALGDDTSGNGNDFTVNNLTSIDQSYDSPTNNFATANPLVPSDSITYSNGNLTLTGSNSTNYSISNTPTFGVSKGKWYCEIKYTTANANTNSCIGVVNYDNYEYNQNVTGGTRGYVALRFDGNLFINAVETVSYFSAPSAGDILMIAMDMDNGKVYFGNNGTWFNSGNPATSTNPASTILTSGTWTPVVRYLASVFEWNFGYPAFTISSGNADANGFGNFEYAVPSGYYALCTKNLALYG